MTDTFTAEPRDVEAAFRTVFPHVGTDAHLPLLNVVHVEAAASTLLLAATDRFTIAAYRADLGEWAPKGEKAGPLEPLDVNFFARDLRRLFAFARSQKKEPARWVLAKHALAVELADGSQLSIRTVELEWVKYRLIFEQFGQRPEPAERADYLNVSPTHLAKFTASAEVLARSRYDVPPLQLWPTSPVRGIPVTIGDRFAGAIMPVREHEALTLDLAGVIAAPAEAPAALPAGGAA